MKNKTKLLIVPFLAVLLTSCGYGLKEYYDGNAYATGDFDKDYYRVWDDRINLENSKNKVVSSETHVLNDEEDYVFSKYNDANFRLVDRDAYSDLTYEDDYFPGDSERYLNVGYGPTRKMARIDSSFKYGYISKLFDGQMFCHSRYQYARVQIDEKGFGYVFSKECNLDTYFAINFKASYDYTKYEVCDFSVYPTSRGNVPNNILTTVNLKISFYCKNDKGFVKKTFTHELDVITNGSENPNIYTFFGFRTTNYDLSRVAGFSIEYDFDRDDINKNPMRDLKDFDGNPYTLDHSLMLYEVFMPKTIWK